MAYEITMTNASNQAELADLVVARPEGLYCPPGDFYIDPWQPVERAVITHAHSDHARFGHRHYLASKAGANVLLSRLAGITLQTLAYGERLDIGGTTVSLHPAGHVLGSAQLRIEHKGRVWVASGDYKLDPDPTCEAFEPVRCDTFITESTFGLPIYRWDAPQTVFDGVDSWWRHNAAEGRASVLFCYSFGKAQRVLASVDAGIGPIFCHGAVEPLNRAYRDAGVRLPPVRPVSEIPAKDKAVFRHALIVAPPSAQGSAWLKRFGDYSDAFASGWMRLRGAGAAWIAASCCRITRIGPACKPRFRRQALNASSLRTVRSSRWCAGCASKASRRARLKRNTATTTQRATHETLCRPLYRARCDDLHA